MKATITNCMRSENRLNNKSKVYLSGDGNSPDSIIDAWFVKHEIWNLEFKCKTWTKVKNVSNKLIKPVIKELLKCDKVNYSVNCGCGCGCSPGYNVSEFESFQYRDKEIWIEITGDTKTGDELRALLEKKFTPLLKLEIESHKDDE